MSEIKDEARFSQLVGLIKHSNELASRWVITYLGIQTGMIMAEATIIYWITKSHYDIILIFLACVLAVFAVASSETTTRILVRNRFWLKHYVKEVIRIEGKNGIWLENLSPPGRSLDQQFIFLNNCVVIGWILFVFILIFSLLRGLL